MGSFAVLFVPSMSLDQLREYERILSCETVDLFSFVSGQKPVPEVQLCAGKCEPCMTCLFS